MAVMIKNFSKGTIDPLNRINILHLASRNERDGNKFLRICTGFPTQSNALPYIMDQNKQYPSDLLL